MIRSYEMDTQSVRVIEMARKEYRECFFYIDTPRGEHRKDENSLYGKIV